MEHQQQQQQQEKSSRRRDSLLNCDMVCGGNENGRERLKRHRSEVAGKVVVPDKWSQEEMLKDWLDFASFDALLAPKGFDLARAALVAERRQANNKEAAAAAAMESNNNKAYLGMHYSATRCLLRSG
ncbi:hypothetical protein QQ045_004104 [Rhodiola kirilowii]